MLVHDHLAAAARHHPDAECAVAGGRGIPHAQAWRTTQQIARALASELEPGARVALLARNRVEYALVCFACSQARVVPVLLNWRLAAREWAAILGDAEARLVLAAHEFAPGLDGVRDALPGVRSWVDLDAAPSEGWRAWDAWLESSGDALPARAQPEDAALQLYTSGTTGRPKGVVHTHASLCAAAAHWQQHYPLGPGERQLVVLPMYHVGGLLYALYAAACAASVYLLDGFDAPELPRILDEEHIARASFVPAMIRQILDVPDVGARGYRELRFLTYGASAIDPDTLARAMDVFDCDFGQCFGMTELPNLTYLTARDHRVAARDRPELLLSVGRPGPDCEVRVVDGEGRDVSGGDVGEIWGRGPQCMQGYWRQPEATAAALEGGWMHTGDAGRLDADGNLYVVDRIKDMIVSGGENVYPREVELVLLEHPLVADVAVIGAPSERWGETVKAVIVARGDRPPEPEELVAFCRERIAGYKLPRLVEFVPELPRNASGKLLKNELRAAP